MSAQVLEPVLSVSDAGASERSTESPPSMHCGNYGPRSHDQAALMRAGREQKMDVLRSSQTTDDTVDCSQGESVSGACGKCRLITGRSGQCVSLEDSDISSQLHHIFHPCVLALLAGGSYRHLVLNVKEFL